MFRYCNENFINFIIKDFTYVRRSLLHRVLNNLKQKAFKNKFDIFVAIDKLHHQVTPVFLLYPSLIAPLLMTQFEQNLSSGSNIQIPTKVLQNNADRFTTKPTDSYHGALKWTPLHTPSLKWIRNSFLTIWIFDTKSILPSILPSQS